ncbi:vomeronasal type-2 receptor 26-like [Leptodactylus fuscus]|uniref:vomeronasal type-2 receptor 26-like n=1 Tax=Leptodactylus fuscus TaxID=238119 RepID=UPI003F4E7193
MSGITPALEYEYHQEGDVTIGGLISVHTVVTRNIHYNAFNEDSCLYFHCIDPQIEKYRSILSFIFAVDEINRDPDLLPNITLGYHIFGTCANSLKTVQDVFQILSGRHKKAPNYSCRGHEEVAAFMVDSEFYTRQSTVELLSQYKYTMLSYGVADPLTNDRVLYPTLFQFAPDDRFRYKAIVKCLQYFGWNWVGIVTTGEGSDEMGVRDLMKLMAEHQICIDFIINLLGIQNIKKKISESDKSSVNVIVVCGSFTLHYLPIIYELTARKTNVTFIFHESWISIFYGATHFSINLFNCSLVLMVPKKTIPKVTETLVIVNPSTHPNDPVLEDIRFSRFGCLSESQAKNIVLERLYKFEGMNCSSTSYIPPHIYEMKDTNLYYTYVSVYILAHALSKLSLTRNTSGKYQQKLQKSLETVHYTDPGGQDIYFNDRGEVPFPWLLVNWVVFNTTEVDVVNITENLAAILKESPQGTAEFVADPKVTGWKNDRKPQSRCNEPCSPGYRKAPNGGNHVCCYDCIPCSEGEVSNITDSETCHKCPEEEWPDEKKVTCLPKTYEFLSYKEDILVPVFLLVALFLFTVTLLILGSFIYYWDTPIVKANNRTVSFILLVSILLGFLCVFFFLGRPVDITCLLRQTSFGIFFSIGVSSLLAKTITVCIAFKATKPGSFWVKMVLLKISNSVVLVCSSIQVLICVIWLSVSPPYVEFDHHSYPGKIIIQCNEGSDIAFYIMLGYLGFLSAVCFVLAFMVRTLPDNFNEAKYITFSMLLFCSVRIAMIPAYVSTKGKSLVIIEIFAILTSCAGILGCIFLPKLYILLIKPELNSRNIILDKK